MTCLYSGSFVSTSSNFYVRHWLCWAVCCQGPGCTSWLCNLFPLSYRFGCLCSRSALIWWSVTWHQSAVKRAVCQKAKRSLLGPPRFPWEPRHRAALVLGPCLGWAVRVSVPGFQPCWSWPWLADLTFWLGLRPGSSLWACLTVTGLLANVVTVTGPAPLFLLGHCGTMPLYTEVLSLPALLSVQLTFAPPAPQAPLQLLHCPAPGG